MAFNRSRYVTVCQQFLTTAVVLATGFSAAGVLTLDIVTPDPSTQAEGAAPTGQAQTGQAQTGPGRTGQGEAPSTQVRQRTKPTPTDARPVQPKVREVSVATAPPAESAESPAESHAPQRDDSARRAPAADPDVTKGVGPDRSVVAVSDPEEVSGFATVGVTWKGGQAISEDDLRVEVRTEDDGRWSGWTEAEFHDDHGPDQGSAEAGRQATRPGTDALVIGDVDRVQMRATSHSGKAPEDVHLAIIDPGVGKQVEQAPAIDTAKLEESSLASSEGPLKLSAMAVAPKPQIYSRAQWGANERMRDGKPKYGTIKTGFVHHTVNANNYSASQVPALIRGIYAYHTQSRKWSDIGYNFLVDRFGRIWEGRAGGVDKAVVGAHTLGYNEVSFAMSAIGNFETAVPSAAVLDAYSKLFAWKLSMYDIPADATRLWVKNKYFQAINGHRDAGSTACPGRHLYYRLSVIRKDARAIQVKGGNTPPPAPSWQPTMTPLATIEQPSGATFPESFNLAGDNRPDLVTVDGSGTLRTVRTGGVTDFGAARATGPDWSGFTATHMVGDLNRDGRPDFVNQVSNGLAVAYTTGADGTLRRLGNTTSRFVGYSHIAGVGDINGDGRTDVVAMRNSNGYVYKFFGNGKGAFSSPQLLTRGLKRWGPKMYTVGNIMGSKHDDLALVDSRNRLWVWPSIRMGRYGTPVRLPSVGGATFLGMGDVDADGRADLVWSKGRVIYALPGEGNGRFRASAFGPIVFPAGLRLPKMANLTGSPHADVVGINRAGRPAVSAHNGRRNFEAPITTTNKIPATSAVLSVGDWNRDGRNDIITRHNNGARLTLRLGLGNGKFANGITMVGNWSRITELAAVGDVTGDGMVDLAGRVGDYGMRIFPGNGGRGFWSVRWAPTRLVTFGQMGSGQWLPREMPESVYPSTADNRFVPIGGRVQSEAARMRTVDPATYDVVLGSGDLDGDGKADLMVRQKSNGTMWMLKGDGSGGSSARIFLGKGFAAYRALG